MMKIIKENDSIRYVSLSYNNAYHIKRSSYKLRQLDAEGAVEADGELQVYLLYKQHLLVQVSEAGRCSHVALYHGHSVKI